MKIVDNRALLLKLRNPQRVTTVIPKSKQLPDNRVLVNWGVEESHVLKNLNINVPSPIEGLYDWPGKYKPFSHQRTTSSFLPSTDGHFVLTNRVQVRPPVRYGPLIS